MVVATPTGQKCPMCGSDMILPDARELGAMPRCVNVDCTLRALESLGEIDPDEIAAPKQECVPKRS